MFFYGDIMYAMRNKNFMPNNRISKFKKLQLVRTKCNMNICNYMLLRGGIWYTPKNVISKVYSNNQFYY